MMKEDWNHKSRSVFDPRPLECRSAGSKALEEFRYGLLSFGQPSEFLDIRPAPNVPNVLENSPIILSSTSQKDCLLFFFEFPYSTYYSFIILYCCRGDNRNKTFILSTENETLDYIYNETHHHHHYYNHNNLSYFWHWFIKVH